MQLMVDISGEQLLARLAGAGDRLQQNMVRVVTRLSIEVQAAVKDKLSGGVLHVRTGTLRRSINRVVAESPSGVVATVGTNVKYAGVHEFGFDGDVQVRSFERKLKATSDLATRKLKSGNVSTPTGNTFISRSGGDSTRIAPRPTTVTVRAYSRHMVMPERSFLRSTLTDYTPRIRSELRAAALEVLLS